jgi:hypothetical protein
MHELERPAWSDSFEEWPSLYMRDHEIVPSAESSFSTWLEFFSEPRALPSYSTVYLYLSLEEEDEDLVVQILSAMPGVDTWLSYELDMGATDFWATAFDIDMHSLETETPVADWALRNGLCPGQWFVAKLEPTYVKHASFDYGTEWDFACGATITDREAVDQDWSLEQWLHFLTGVRDDGTGFGAPLFLNMSLGCWSALLRK